MDALILFYSYVLIYGSKSMYNFVLLIKEYKKPAETIDIADPEVRDKALNNKVGIVSSLFDILWVIIGCMTP